MPDGVGEGRARAGDRASSPRVRRTRRRRSSSTRRVLRSDPDNEEARDALKRLYKQTQGYNALVELLRQQLERTPASAYEERLDILREIATVYREYIEERHRAGLGAEPDRPARRQARRARRRRAARARRPLREARPLARSAHHAAQARRADARPEEKKDALPRRGAALARSVLQRAERDRGLRGAARGRAATIGSARTAGELYRKRRAWPQLYELYERELADRRGRAALALADRDGAARRRAPQPRRRRDALCTSRSSTQTRRAPKCSTRSRSRPSATRTGRRWPRCSSAASTRRSDDAARLAVLQKLGTVYAEHLADHASRGAHLAARARALAGSPARAARAARRVSAEAATTTGSRSSTARRTTGRVWPRSSARAADRAKDTAPEIELSYRAAAVFEEQLSQPERAFRSYERILAADPTDARAARALSRSTRRTRSGRACRRSTRSARESADDVDEKLEHPGQARRGHRQPARRPQGGRRLRARAPTSSRPSSIRSRSACSRMRRARRQPGSRSSRRCERRLAASARVRAAGAEAAARRRRKGADDEPSGVDANGGQAERRCVELKLARVYADELGRDRRRRRPLQARARARPDGRGGGCGARSYPAPADRRDDLRWLLELRVENASGRPARGCARCVEWAALEEDVFECARAGRCAASPQCSSSTRPTNERSERCRASCSRPATRPARPR